MSQTCIEIIAESAQTSAALQIAQGMMSIMAGWTNLLPTIRTESSIETMALPSIGFDVFPAEVWTFLGVMIGWTSVLPTIETQLFLWIIMAIAMGFDFTSTDGIEGCVVIMLLFWWIRAMCNGCYNLLEQLLKKEKAPPWSDPAPYVLGGGGYGYAMTQY